MVDGSRSARHRIEWSARLGVLVLLFASNPVRAQPRPQVTIETNPPGASVYIDGKEQGLRGNTPLKIRLPIGTHKVLLELEGHSTIEQVVQVSQAQRFTFKMNPAPARLEVKAPATNESATGGELFIDGSARGTVPSTVEVPAGRHLIEVKRAGFLTFAEQVEVRVGEARTCWVTMKPAPPPPSGALRIESDIEGSVVLIDGVTRGIAPLQVQGLAVADHLVEVRVPEHDVKPWRQIVSVIEGETIQVHARPTRPPPPAVAEAAFHARDASTTYQVSVGPQTCATPCTLKLKPGASEVSVSGPRTFAYALDLPPGTSHVEVQHWRLSNVIAGSILTVVGVALVPAGATLVGDYLGSSSFERSQDTGKIVGGSIALGLGAASLIAGVVELATIRSNKLTPKP